MSKNQDMAAMIHKYLTSQVTSEEKRFVEAWLLESDENHEMFEDIKLIWDNSEEEAIEISDNEMKEGLYRLEKAVAKNILEEHQQNINRFRVRDRYKNIAVAVVLAVTFISILASYVQNDLLSKEFIVSGQREILLPDSTEVFTNKETTLSFHQNLWKREAHLDGEAFFEVQRDERRPFVIHVGETSIKVLGTSFLVKAYPDQRVQVSVVSGKVAIQHKDHIAEIRAGEEVLVTGNDELKKSPSIDPNLLAWKTGRLIFKNSLVSEVLKDLGQLHDVRFETKDDRNVNSPGSLITSPLRKRWIFSRSAST